MSLKIRALKLVVKAGDKDYGCQFNFSTTGLNVIRAENSSGKSTVYNSILFALGIEMILGNTTSKHVPLPYILSERVPLEGESSASITESAVMMEIENHKGESVTVRRSVVPGSKSKIVTVYSGKALTDLNHQPSGAEDYYIRHAGHAQNDRGYHFWLARFIGWSLPEVPKYAGGTLPLYLECIAPLFVIEQKRGWSQLQATVPTQYGIKDVRQRAIEFLLKLDSTKIDNRRYEINSRLNAITSAWMESVRSLKQALESVSGIVEGLPSDPRAMFATDVSPTLKVSEDGHWWLLDQKISLIEKKLNDIDRAGLPTAADERADFERDLSRLEEELFEREALYRQYLHQLSMSLAENDLLKNRVVLLNDDLRQMNDAYTLSKLGGQAGEVLNMDSCPVCSSALDGSVLSQDVRRHVMDIQENKAFLSDELKTAEVLHGHGEKKIETIKLMIEQMRVRSNDTREKIRALKESLVQDSRLPSLASIKEKAALDLEIQRLKRVKEEVSIKIEILRGLSGDFAEQKKLLAELPERFSDSDEDKLSNLEDSLKSNLKAFLFKSFEPDLLTVSRDTLHPAVQDFDWYFEASGSDNIRAIWAYTLALLSVANAFSTNHPGFTMFDEPGQHSAKGASLEEFFKRASAVSGDRHQVIVTTSEAANSVRRYLSSLPAKKFIFEDGIKLIEPLDRRLTGN